MYLHFHSSDVFERYGNSVDSGLQCICLKYFQAKDIGIPSCDENELEQKINILYEAFQEIGLN